MEILSNVAKEEKNKLNTDSIFLITLEIEIPDTEEIIYIVNNNEDIVWDGTTYLAFPFTLEEFSESATGEVSEFAIKVSNVNNIIGNIVKTYDAYVKNNGFEPIKATISVVNNKNLTDPSPEIQHKTTLLKPTIAHESVIFKLGGVNAYNKTVHNRMFRNSCRFKFKSVQCGYTGGASSCDKTYATCVNLNNEYRYGGFPTIGNKGILI